MYTHLSIVYNHDMAILRSLLLLLSRSLSLSVSRWNGNVCGTCRWSLWWYRLFFRWKYRVLPWNKIFTQNYTYSQWFVRFCSCFGCLCLFFTSFSLMNRTAKAVLISKIATTICHIDHFIDGRQCVVLPTNNIQILWQIVFIFVYAVVCCLAHIQQPPSLLLSPPLLRALSRPVSLSRYLLYFDFQYCGYIWNAGGFVFVPFYFPWSSSAFGECAYFIFFVQFCFVSFGFSV